MLSRFSATDRQAFREGVRSYSPMVVAMLSWGLVTGIAMSKSGLTTPQSLGMTLLVYAGSAQLAVLPLMIAKLPMWTILLTAAMVNTRFVIFSAGLAPHFSYLPLKRRLLLSFFNGDVVYLLFIRRNYQTGRQPGKEAYYWGMALLAWLSWQVSSIVGILLANLFPDNWGVDLAGTLVLIPIMVSAVAGRSALLAVLAASCVALLAFDLPYRLGLPLAVVTALVAGFASDVLADQATLRRIRKESAARKEAG